MKKIVKIKNICCILYLVYLLQYSHPFQKKKSWRHKVCIFSKACVNKYNPEEDFINQKWILEVFYPK